MPAPDTRRKIVMAAESLYYRHGVRAVSVDAIALRAGVTKKTVYYHFRSKDDIVASYLAARNQPNLQALKDWFGAGGATLECRLSAMFEGLMNAARHPRWRGCAFLRTAYELASMPGHPAFKAGAAHKKAFEDWLAAQLVAEGQNDAPEYARQISLLIDGAFSAAMIHRDAGYFRSAGLAAVALMGSERRKLTPKPGPTSGRARSSTGPPQ
jgi:AcrR family transcriptional regulator